MPLDVPGLTIASARSGSLSRPGEESLLVYGVAFWLALIQVSIAASQIVLAVLVAGWLYRASRHETAIASLPFDRPFALYATLTLTAAVFSFDPKESLTATKELLLLVIPYVLVSALGTREALDRLVLVVVAMADVSALVGLWQYRFGELGDINHRIHGFMGHYMTYSGLLMGVGVLALAGILFSARSRHRWFLVASFLLIQLTLALTLTRSAWIGTIVAATLLLFFKDRRLPLLVPLAAIVAAMLLPHDVERRVFSIVSPDTSGWDRVHMLRAGARMVSRHPFLGVGPEMVAEVYPIYVDADAERRDNPHLHNNLAQIAAERGVLCLLAWLWLVATALLVSVRAFRRTTVDGSARALAAGAVGAIVAGFVAGLFEYNFGDSEFQMLFLFVVSIPLVLARANEAEAPEELPARS